MKGLKLTEVLKASSDPALWSRYMEAQQYGEKYGYKEDQKPNRGVSYYNAKAIRDLGRHPAQPSENPEELYDQLVKQFRFILQSEELWAIGYKSPVEHDDAPMLIPADKWRLLEFDVEGISASGGGLEFSGLLFFEVLEDAVSYCGRSAASNPSLDSKSDVPTVNETGKNRRDYKSVEEKLELRIKHFSIGKVLNENTKSLADAITSLMRNDSKINNDTIPGDSSMRRHITKWKEKKNKLK